MKTPNVCDVQSSSNILWIILAQLFPTAVLSPLVLVFI